MLLTDLETPALVLDGDKFDSNAAAAKAMLDGSKARLRPHYKSHKCSAIAHMQIRDGAVGMTCAKLSEAEDLAYSGIEDILIANQIVEPSKISRLAQLAKKCRLTVCVDNEENARALSEAACAAGSTVSCLVEYELGMRRCGVSDPSEYVRLAKLIAGLPNLEYMGIQAYAGYASHMISTAERVEVTRENLKKVADLVALLKENGLTAKIVSGASTGTAGIVSKSDVYTELQMGSYLYMDSTYNKLDIPFVNSFFVLATVISKRPGITVLDVGAKGLGADQDPAEVILLDGTKVTGEFDINEEHLKIFNASEDLTPGQKVLVIPGHCCTTSNLYSELYVFRNGRVEDRFPISARGCSK